jgi:hypothetical protein
MTPCAEAAERIAPARLVQDAAPPQDDDRGMATISLRFDTQMSPALTAPPSGWGSAAPHGFTLRPESCWETGLNDRADHAPGKLDCGNNTHRCLGSLLGIAGSS